MEYVCRNCGTVFDEGQQVTWEESHGLESGPYEQYVGCPVCNGDFVKTTFCKGCGAPYANSDELYEGLCVSCLRETLSPTKALNYLIDSDSFVTFMFEAVFKSSTPQTVSPDLKAFLIADFGRRLYEEIATGSDDLFAACINYIIEGDGVTCAPYVRITSRRNGFCS